MVPSTGAFHADRPLAAVRFSGVLDLPDPLSGLAHCGGFFGILVWAGSQSLDAFPCRMRLHPSQRRSVWLRAVKGDNTLLPFLLGHRR